METKYIPCPGANEFSAMVSAQGIMQEKHYRASFPSLTRIKGMESPSYIMVLKDAAGLVRMYSIVNVSQYNLAATAASKEECIVNYMKLISGKITLDQANTAGEAAAEPSDISSYKPITITIQKTETIVENGNTFIYILAGDGSIYSAKYTEVIEMIRHEEGDILTIMTDGSRFVLPEESRGEGN